MNVIPAWSAIHMGCSQPAHSLCGTSWWETTRADQGPLHSGQSSRGQQSYTQMYRCRLEHKITLNQWLKQLVWLLIANNVHILLLEGYFLCNFFILFEQCMLSCYLILILLVIVVYFVFQYYEWELIVMWQCMDSLSGGERCQGCRMTVVREELMLTVMFPFIWRCFTISRSATTVLFCPVCPLSHFLH